MNRMSLAPIRETMIGIEGRVKKLGRVQPLIAGLSIEEPHAESDTHGHKESVGMEGQGSEFQEDGEHVGFLLKRAAIRRRAPMVMQESATLKNGQCHCFT